MASDDDRADAEVKAFLQNELMKEAKDYLDRGRRLEKVSRAELEAKWVAAFKLFAKQHVGDHVTDMEDAHAELRFRGLDIPEEAVKAELEVMRAEIERDGPASAPPGRPARAAFAPNRIAIISMLHLAARGRRAS